jgi:hypothetical protein
LIERARGNEVRGAVLEAQHGGCVELETALTNENLLHPGPKDFVVGTMMETFKNKRFLCNATNTAPLGELDLGVQLVHPVKEGSDGFETCLGGRDVFCEVRDCLSAQPMGES